MSEMHTCEWCGKAFKSADGLEWHDRAHMREAGLVVDLGRGWAGVAMSTMELPGEYLVVLPSAIQDTFTDAENFEVIKREMDSLKGIIEAIKRWREVQSRGALREAHPEERPN